MTRSIPSSHRRNDAAGATSSLKNRRWRYNECILASTGAQSKGLMDPLAPSPPRTGQEGEERPGPHLPLPPHAPLHLFGPLPDFFLLGPGFTLLVSATLGSMVALGYARMATSLALALGLMFVGPHYAATYRRAFASRLILRAHPVVTLVAPVLLAGAAAAAIAWPRSVGVAFFALYVIWSGYHYSGQSLGLAMLYPLRQGARLDSGRNV